MADPKVQHATHQQARGCVDPGRFAFARSADRKFQIGAVARLLHALPQRRVLEGIRRRQIGSEQRPAIAMRKLAGEFRAVRNLDAAGVENDQAGVRVADIPFSALRRIGKRRFLELRIVRRQAGRRREVFRPAAARTPAGIVDAARHRLPEELPCPAQPDVARTEVVRGGLDGGDAATVAEKECSWVAKGILPN